MSITAVVTLDRSSLLRSLSVTGHAEHGGVGHDIVCSAVSVLARTAGAVLSGRPYIEASVSAPVRGMLYLNIEHEREGEVYLSVVQDFLLEGLRSVAAEYPACLQVEYKQV
ncbi:MAG: ribosomal-processing cysteine protease Prp [Spirochaetaceae bacterium]|nr:ribosomal-processing cysteine protease Prp [Spirochaetaceae bacterium]